MLLCHTSQKLLWDTYKGIATQADGIRFYKITPNYLREKLKAGLITLPEAKKVLRSDLARTNPNF